mmetsp:Transcript_36224/g.55626  ORF Transcript_36224/g.55626 Transcript_36224/m.55626 type:complete len:187 (+) Transcript_36224:3021-3581(+)
MGISTGAFYFQKERFLLRGRQVLESAWLVSQQISKRRKASSPDQRGGAVEANKDLTSKELQKLFVLVNSRKFAKVQSQMEPLRSQWLASDADASLTIKSMKSFEDIVKVCTHTVEQELLTKHINQILWEGLHKGKSQLFNLPVSREIPSDLLGNLNTKSFDNSRAPIREIDQLAMAESPLQHEPIR